MKQSTYTNYDELPLFLNAEMVAKVLGISISSAYELMHEASFPALRVGQPHRCPERKILPVGRSADRWCEMTRNLPWQKPNPVKNYYPVPKVICQLGYRPVRSPCTRSCCSVKIVKRISVTPATAPSAMPLA